MNNETNLLGILVGIFILASEAFSVIATGFLIYQKFKPRPSWTGPLFITWCVVITFAIISALYLLGRHLTISAEDAYGRLTTYMAFLTYLPILISGFIALFLKP